MSAPWGAIFWVVLIGGLTLGCLRPEPPVFQVATNVWPGYEPLYLARQAGDLDSRRIRLVEMPNSTDASRALRAGLVQAAALTLDEVLTLVQDGVSLRVVLVMDISHGADVLLTRPGVERLKDCRVGAEAGALGAYMLARALEAEGVDPSEVKALDITLGGQEEAYLTGKVDAIVTFEPVRTRLLQAGALVRFDSARIPGEIVDVLAVRTEALPRHARDLKALRRAWFRALERIEHTPREAGTLMAPRQGLSPGEVQQALKGLRLPGETEERRLRSGPLKDTARRLADLMLQRRLLRHPVSSDALFSEP